jgi:hypothetical protein
MMINMTVNNFKLGKKPVKVDTRTIKLKSILVPAALPPVPVKYDIDEGMSINIPGSMFGNDSWGCCVIASRANQELRFEFNEQQRVIPISTQDVLDEYWKEGEGIGDATSCWTKFLSMLHITRHPDNGLVMLDSIKDWRKFGWELDGRTYTIYAFAAMDVKDHLEVQQAIYLLNGIQTGISVPKSAMNQFNNNQPWDIAPDNTNIIGGHAIYIVGYNEVGPVCMTWGKKQQMTWAFWDTYVDESYALVDSKNSWQENSPINMELLESYLNTIC